MFWLCSILPGMAQLDPESPEWTIAFVARRFLRRHLGPKHGYLPELLAREIAAHLRLSHWRFVKVPPNPPHSTPGPKAE